MSDPEKKSFRLRSLPLRSHSLEVVKLFSKHGPRWMLSALLLVLLANVALAAIIVNGWR